MKKALIPALLVAVMLVSGCNNSTGGHNSTPGGDVTSPTADHEHNWSKWTITKQPTLENEGEATRTCLVCNTAERVSIPALSDSNTWSYEVYDEPTCQYDGMGKYSSVYGDVYVNIPKGNHTFGHQYHIIEDRITNLLIGQKCDLCGEVGGDTYLKQKPTHITVLKEDNEYSFAYNSTTKTYTTNNKGVNNSEAILTIKFAASGTFSFKYSVSSESQDQFYATKNGGGIPGVYGLSGHETSTEPVTVAVEFGDIIQFKYVKDSLGDGGTDDIVKLSDFSLDNTEELTYNAITYNSNGGTFIEPSILVNGKDFNELPTPTKENSYFAGWYTDEDFANEYTKDTVLVGDKEVFAKWISKADANLFVGNYQGFSMSGYSYTYTTSDDEYGDEYETTTGSQGSLTLRTASLSIDYNGEVSGDFVGKIANEYDSATGIVSFEEYTTKYDSIKDALIIYRTAQLKEDTTVFVLFRNVATIAKSANGSYWLDGSYKTVSFDNANGATSLTIDVAKSKFMWNTSVVDLQSKKISEGDITSEIGFTLLTQKGNSLGYFANNGTKIINEDECDGYQGKYVDNENNRTLLVNGANQLTEIEGETASKSKYSIYATNVIKSDSVLNPYAYNLNKEAHTYARDVIKCAIHLNMMGVTADYDIDAVVGTWIDLPTPDTMNNAFDGWYLDEEYKEKLTSTRYKVTGEVTLYAKWVVKHTVKLHRNNEDGIYNLMVKDGSMAEIPFFTYEGYILEGWYTDEAFNNRFDEATKITEDIDLYANWIKEPKYFGDFKGLWISFSSASCESREFGSDNQLDLSITKDGKYSGGYTGTFNTNVYPTEDGIMDFGNSKQTKIIDVDGQVFITGGYSDFSSLAVPNGIRLFAKTSEEVSATGYALNGNDYMLIDYQIGEKHYEFYINTNKQILMANPVIKENGAEVAMKDALNSKELDIYDTEGNFIDAFVKGDIRFGHCDQYRGEYTGSLYGVTSTVKVNGLGEITVEANGSTYEGTYVRNGDAGIKITYNGKTCAIELSGNTFTQVLDGYEGTYTGPDGDLVLTGWGDATLNGVACTYAIDGDCITVTTGTNQVTYGFDFVNKAYTSVSLSVFAGQTYAGSYYDDWDECSNSYKVVFNNEAEITGRISIGYYSYYWWDFTGTLSDDGTTLTCVVTNAYTDLYKYVGKVVVFTVEEGKLTCTSCGVAQSNGMYNLSGSSAKLQ